VKGRSRNIIAVICGAVALVLAGLWIAEELTRRPLAWRLHNENTGATFIAIDRGALDCYQHWVIELKDDIRSTNPVRFSFGRGDPNLSMYHAVGNGDGMVTVTIQSSGRTWWPRTGDAFSGLVVRSSDPRSRVYEWRNRELRIPLWMPIVAGAMYPIVRVHSWRRSRCRRLENRCVSCGYDLRGSPGRCPECGLIADNKDAANSQDVPAPVSSAVS
jgi:hypothetical protein